MSSYLDLVQLITVRFHDKILKSCAPLFDCLNLNHFWYYKIRNDGRFAFFDSNIAWCEYYGGEKLYLTHPYLRHPKFHREGVYLLKHEFPQDSKLSPAINFKNDFQIINKIPDGVEAYGFSSDSSNEDQYLLFINELNLLRLFMEKFRKENSSIFSYLENNLIDLVDLIGPSFYQNDMLAILEPSTREAYLKKMNFEDICNLSSIELSVMSLLLEGYSAAQIASHLFRSSRTVEHHIERMKEKLGCCSKGELIQKARQMERFNCFKQ